MRGVYRVRRPGPQAVEVWVVGDAGRGQFMIEDDYRAGGYLPPIAALPWEDEYKPGRRNRGNDLAA